MRDMMDCRDWAENRQDLSHDMDRGLGKVMAAFRYLAHYNFSAPWDKGARVKAKHASC